MKQVRVMGVFYLLYFSWLMVIIFLSADVSLLNYFSATITLFYIVFLREKWDIVLFPAGALAPFLIIYFTTVNPDIAYLVKTQFEPWIFLAWGTTVVAAHKLSTLAIRGKVYQIG